MPGSGTETNDAVLDAIRSRIDAIARLSGPPSKVEDSLVESESEKEAVDRPAY